MNNRILDKFYTKYEIALFICNKFKDIIFQYDFIIEPSVGNGAFIKALKQLKYKGKILSIDIVPEFENSIKTDFLKLKIKSKDKILVIGNPPFGKNSSLALKFLKKAKKFANEIIFILPNTFHKESFKYKLNGLKLIESFYLPNNSFLFENREYDVPTSVFHFRVEEFDYKIEKVETDLIKFVKKEEADYAIRRVGALAGKVLEEFDKFSPNSNYFVKSSNEVKEFLKKNYNELQKISRMTAGNPSLSKNELKRFIKDNFLYN